MRRLAIATMMMASAIAYGQARHYAPQTESVRYAYNMGMGINVGNNMDAQADGIANETAWGNKPMTQMLMDSIRAVGFKTVRIPVTWLGRVGDAPDYAIDAAWMNRVAEVVKYAHKAKLNVIINIHHDGANSHYWLNVKKAAEDDAYNAQTKAKIAAMWRQIATRFKGEGEYLMFESFNEIHDGKWGWGDNRKDGGKQYEVLNEWNQVFVDAVRQAGGKNAKRYLGVLGYCTNIDLTIQGFRMPADPANRTLVSVHFYDPHLFTLECQNNEWGYHADASKTAAGGNEQDIMRQFNDIYNAFVAKGIGVYVGEMGAARRANDHDEWYRKAYLDFVCRQGADYGIPMIYWDNGAFGTGRESEGLMDRETGTFRNNGREIAELMVSALKDERPQVEFVTDMGTFVVELFNETPLHRDNFIKQVKDGTYDGVLWHRVINKFIIQTGDRLSKHAKPGEMLGEGDEKPSDRIPAEFRIPRFFHMRGMLNAAREGDDTNPQQMSSSTQFTVVTGRTFTDAELDRNQQRVTEWTKGKCQYTDLMRGMYRIYGGAPHLDGSYTVFGRVISGMDVVDKIQVVDTDKNDRPLKDVRIKSAKVL